MFKFITDLARKADAANLLQNLIEFNVGKGVRVSNLSSKDLAAKVITGAVQYNSNLLGGKSGIRPHKFAFVLYSVALAAVEPEGYIYQFDASVQVLMLSVFGTVVSELKVNHALYGLTDTDYSIIENAAISIKPIIDLHHKFFGV